MPTILVIDPITGQKMRAWEGMVSAERLLEVHLYLIHQSLLYLDGFFLKINYYYYYYYKNICVVR
jgi:hypothetical protein